MIKKLHTPYIYIYIYINPCIPYYFNKTSFSK